MDWIQQKFCDAVVKIKQAQQDLQDQRRDTLTAMEYAFPLVQEHLREAALARANDPDAKDLKTEWARRYRAASSYLNVMDFLRDEVSQGSTEDDYRDYDNDDDDDEQET